MKQSVRIQEHELPSFYDIGASPFDVFIHKMIPSTETGELVAEVRTGNAGQPRENRQTHFNYKLRKKGKPCLNGVQQELDIDNGLGCCRGNKSERTACQFHVEKSMHSLSMPSKCNT